MNRPANSGSFVKSEDGVVSVSLDRRGDRLRVQRERRYTASSMRVVQTTVFRDLAVFLRWCDQDTIRFDYPMLASQVRKTGAFFLGEP